MKKYITSGSRIVKSTIHEVDAERETKSYIWVKGRKNAKTSDYECYHDSFEAAKAFLVSTLDKQVQDAETRLKRAKQLLDDVEKTTKPEKDSNG